MKKRVILFLFLFLCIPYSVHAINISYNEATQAVKQSIQAWYMRGSNLQYNTARNTYDVLRHPEDATAQDADYLVCSGFTNVVLMEAFGFKAEDSKVYKGNTPIGSGQYCDEANSYLTEKNCKTTDQNPVDGCKGEYVLLYSSNMSNTEKQYIYNPKKLSQSEVVKQSNIIDLLHAGDILSYNGHVVIVYDVVTRNGKKDALLFNAGYRDETILSKIAFANNQLYYHKIYNKNKNNFLDLNQDTYLKFEGTIYWRWLSEYKFFFDDNGNFRCNKGKENSQCSITRPFYKDPTPGSRLAILNYNVVWPQQIRTSRARMHLPGIFIQKTSSKRDNDSVELGNIIIYTLRIINNSNLVKDGSTDYTSGFYVEETVPDEYEITGTTVEGTLEGTREGNTIKWYVPSLKAGETVIIKYKVKVKNDTNNIGHFAEMNGKVYRDEDDYSKSNYIGTGTVRHEIVNSTSKTAEDYLNCYNSKKREGYTFLDLIQQTYQCVYGDTELDFNFNTFRTSQGDMLNSLIVKNFKGVTSNENLHLNKEGERATYADMILNNYWNGLVRNPNNNKFLLSNWRTRSEGNKVGNSERAKTIRNEHFQAGDVLIYYVDKNNTPTDLQYTKENGLYAYIYLNGKFVGVNHPGESNERNEFAKEYYTEKGLDISKNLYDGIKTYYDFANLQTLLAKDSYVILRPEKVITEVSKITVKTNPSKTTYFKKENLDVAGGVIQVTNNDGTKEDINMNDSRVKVTGYKSTEVGEQTLTVKYKEKNASFKVNVVENNITSISVKQSPTKTVYYVGESLVLDSGIIQVNYQYGSSENISLKNKNITVSGFNSSQAGTKTVTVNYGGKTASFNVEVKNVTYDSLTVKKLPTKTEYNVGESLSLTGGVVEKHYNNGTIESVSMTDSSVQTSGFNSATAGVKTIQVTVNGKSTTFEVAVNETPNQQEVITSSSMTIQKVPTITTYYVGDSLNLANGYIIVHYYTTIGNNVSNRTYVKGMSSSGVTVSGFSSDTPGEKTITVSYDGMTATFTVTVVEKPVNLTDIEVTTLPFKENYIQYREELEASGGELTLTYSNDSEEVIALTDENVQLLDFDNTQLDTQNVQVIYQGLETSFPVTIREDKEDIGEEDDNGVIQSIEAIQEPDKKTYIQGVEAFDVTGIVIKIEYEDGFTSVIDLMDIPGQYEILGYDNTKAGEQTVTIRYKGHEVSFKVVVQPEYISVPNTKRNKSVLTIIFSLILIISGAIVMYYATSKNKRYSMNS